ncbi:MAG: enoyl-CoA hydratase/isomerase family protein [Chloroflexota bacterium]
MKGTKLPEETGQDILVERREAVATVTFNRPAQRNAISYEMWQELGRVARALSEDDSIRVVVFRGAGSDAFSAGADIKDFERHRYDSASARKYGDVLDFAMDAVETMPKPTISMIQGFCVGGGLEFAAATDLRIAATGSRFGVPVAKIGIVAGYKEMRRMVALCGPGNAAYIVLTGDLVESEEAFRMGLLNKVTDPASLEAEVYGLADKISALAPVSHADHKAIIRTVLRNPGLQDMTAEEKALPFRVFDTEDFRIGTSAFVDKTRPEFKGR